MRKLIFILALLCCSTRGMAQCNALQGKVLNMVAGGISSELGPLDFTGQQFFFMFAAADSFTHTTLTGSCIGNQIAFARVFGGAIVQAFTGKMDNPPGKPLHISGTFSQTAHPKDLNWTATVTNVASSFPLQTCQKNCALTHCPGGKPPCSKCFSKCLIACDAGKNDDPTCQD